MEKTTLKKAVLLVTVLVLPIFTACVSAAKAGADDGLYGETSVQEILPDSYEPDSMQAPVLVTQGDWVSRTLHTNDEDWFSFIPGAAGLLVAETDGDTEPMGITNPTGTARLLKRKSKVYPAENPTIFRFNEQTMGTPVQGVPLLYGPLL